MFFFSDTLSMTTYLTASIGGFVALALLIFSLYIFIKYRFVCVRMQAFFDSYKLFISEWRGARKNLPLKLLTELLLGLRKL